MGFWIQLGVSGFRMDAVPFVIATKGADVQQAASSSTTCCARLREFLQWREGDAIILAEANVLPDTDMQYFGDDGDRHAHDVQLPGQPAPVLRAGHAPIRGRWRRRCKRRKRAPATAQWGMFLRNHDELDLGRLTDAAARRRCSPRSAPNQDMQLYERGIRRRLAPMLDGDRRRLELAYSLMFTLPGTPVHPLRRRDRHGRRPAPAGAQVRAHADAMVDRAARRLHQAATSPVLPVISDGPYGYRARQRGGAAARSELAAELDRAHHPHAQGSARDRLGRLRDAAHRRRTTCSRMRYDWRNNSVVCVHNFSAAACTVKFRVGRAPETPARS